MGHPVVTQVIAVLEAIVLPAETRVMKDHPALETVGPQVVGMAAVTAVATVVVMAAVMVEVMVVVMAVATAAETNRSYQKETLTFPLT